MAEPVFYLGITGITQTLDSFKNIGYIEKRYIFIQDISRPLPA